MKNAIVTRDSLRDMLLSADSKRQAAVLGRALHAIFLRQTQDEKHSNTTNHDNGVGFTGADAYSGALTAKYWLKHATLLDWQIERWLKVGKSGYPRICKYHAQLNEIAQEKAKQKQSVAVSV